MKTYSYSQIWRIAYPILISMLMEQLVGMTDAAFLGRVGEIELGASALGGIFYIAVFMLGLGFSIGAQILIGRRNGEGNYLSIGNIFYHSVAFLLITATVLFILARLFAPMILNAIIASPAVATAANDYLHWRVPGFFFAFVTVMFRAFYVGTTNTRTLTLNSMTMVLCNVIFNYVLIFGKLGLPAFGIAGAAMGSTLAEGVSLLFFIIYTRLRIDYRKYGLHQLPHFRLNLLGNILGMSLWTMLQNFLSLATWCLFFLSVEHLGERDLAVTNIIRNISSFSFMTVIALASTASTLVSNLMGQREVEAVPGMLRRTVFMGYVILTPLLLFELLFPETVLGIFTNETALIDAGRAPLYVLVSSYLITIPGQIYFHAVSGTGNTRTALAFELAALAIYTIFVVVVIFHLKAPLYVCWLSEHIYAVFAFLFTWQYMRRGNWRNKQI